MGGSKSKLSILSYEDAEKRITEKELNRLKRAFNQFSQKKLLSFDKFCSEVFGSFLPNMVSNTLFKALNTNHSPSGINFKELLIGIVILTKGCYDEKCKFFFSLYCNETGFGIELEFIKYAADKTTSKDYIASVLPYLDENSILSLDNFMKWIKENPTFNEISRWLLTTDFNPPLLTDDSVPQDIYQLVAGVTHLDEFEIIELEKTYHRLIFGLTRNLNLSGFTELVCPPLPETIVDKVFRTFDENNDGIIDFNELACGISACCRGPKTERKKFCCKIFNENMDGKFTQNDIEYIFQICEETKFSEMVDKNKIQTLYSDLISSILSSKEMTTKNYISIDDLLIWINDYDFLDPFLNLMNQICMVVFGLKPKNIFEEELVITQWILREQNLNIIPYDHVYVINKSWMNQWINSFRNLDKDDSTSKDNSVKSVQSNSKITHSISMNNVFVNRRHHYDLTKSNKSFNRENSKNQINGRFIYHSKIQETHDIVQHIYSDFTGINDQINSNGSLNSISSISSNNSFSGISRTNKLNQINNQNLLQINNAKLSMNVTILTEDGGVLSPTLRFNEDYEFLPPPIWNCFQNWYGTDIIIKRPIWTENRDNNSSHPTFDDHCITFRRYQSIVKVEIQLLTLFIMKHVLSSASSTVNGIAPFNQFNIGLSANSFYKDLSAAKRQIVYRASFSHKSRIIDLIDFLSKKLNINREEMRIWKFIADNNLTLLDDEEKFLQDLSLQNFDKILVEQRNVDLTWPEELNQLVTLKSLQNRKASVSKGVTGLSNIGNTCFFNSAIQCISNTNILTEYFIRDVHLCEINKNNPQGSQGIVALRYGELIKDIWTGSTNLIIPLKLKMTLEKYAKQFSGNQQHDAQELLSVLLDALHEDLNRIDTKPSYKELKDSDGRHDNEVAQEAWQAHIETNCSIVVDLFHGLLKSNVCCDICKTNSVRFDAYSMLSLPIPMQLNQDFEVLVFGTYSTTPRKCCVLFNTTDSTSSFICEQLSKQLSIPSSSVLLASIEDNKIKKFLNPNDKIYITQSLYAYVTEDQYLPNSNDTDKNNDASLSQGNLVKFIIYNRKLIQKTNYFMAHSRLVSELFGYPMVLTVKKDDIDKITYQDIQDRVTRILNDQLFHSSVRPNDQSPVKQYSPVSIIKPNHAVDCDSVNQRHPFILSQVSSNIKHCSICHWTKFCYGCTLPRNSNIYNIVGPLKEEQYLAIDWSLSSLHLSFSDNHDKKVLLEDINRNNKSINNQPMDLIKCIESFTTQETLDLDTLYQCYKCKKPQRAHKKLDLWTLPPILIIHLKRFQFLDKRWQKSHKIVHYPIRNLDLSKFIHRDNNNNIANPKDSESLTANGNQLSNENEAIYNLYAVNCHLGNLQMGHYVTYALNKESNKWYLFNDSICKEVDEKDITTSCAYLLFYERANLNSNLFLDKVISKVHNTVPQAVEVISDEVESDIKKYCIIQ